MAKRLEWVVIRSKHGHESKAAANVENSHGLETYAPRIREYGKVKALFPSYAFVQIKGRNWGFLLRTKGVRGVLMAGDHPSVVPDEVIDTIKKEEGDNGLVDLKKGFTFRQRLAIVGGPFQEGLYLGMSSHNRVRVLFELLGKETTKDIDIKRVRPLDAP